MANEGQQAMIPVSKLRIFLYRLKRRFYSRIMDLVKTASFWIIKRRYADGPVPLAQIRPLHRLLSLFGKQHPFTPSNSQVLQSSKSLRNSSLAAELHFLQIGGYSLDIETLNFIELLIQQRHPSLILEFGSGISTLCMTHYMRELWGCEQLPYVVSLEQDPDYAARTRELLEANKLADFALVYHVPLALQRVTNKEVLCYDIPKDFPDAILSGRKPDFVIIDGPSGGGNTRLGTLPLVQNWLAPSAYFLLDDALRDWELSIANEWSRINGIQVLGIHFVGKGLLSGYVT